jgi:hypothetical protein
MSTNWRVFAIAFGVAMTVSAGGVFAGAANPAAPGFDAAGSDARAIEIADRTMEAMGGRDHWDAVQRLGWSIFHRTHTWNKWTGDYRLDADTLVVIMNVNSGKGRVWGSGHEITDAGRLSAILDRAHSIWINDMYWFLMPYKLKDSGVTLKYGGDATTADGRAADKLVLTFQKVGDTPENKYDVLVARDTGLVAEWSYYENASDAQPKFTLPWTDWTDFDGIKLSTGRGRVEITGVSASSTDDGVPFQKP